MVAAVPAGGADRPPTSIQAVTLAGTVRVLTTRQGLDTAPAVSPKTGAIAFVSDRGGPLDIYVMSAAGTGARRLTTSPFTHAGGTPDQADKVASNDAGTTSIAWSPDGTRLAFDAQNATFSSDCMTNCVVWSVWVVNADGTGLRQVADQARSPKWSADGLRLAVEGTVTPYGESESVDIVPLTSAPVVRIPAFNQYASQGPAWSSRGVLAYQRFRGNDPPLWIQTADAAGRHRRYLVTGTQPAWSSAGTRIAFVRGGRLMVTDAKGEVLRRFSRAGETVSLPAWSPDGARIAFLAHTSAAGSTDGLAVVTLRTGVERRLMALQRGSTFNSGPVWSRDGVRILVPVSAGG